MREYKFRAWDKKINKMFYSDDCFFSFINGNFIERDGENGSDKDSQIVMQCTGLKDKNGKEIYEGDIAYKNMCLDVSYHKGSYCVWYTNNWFALNEIFCLKEIEIMGNIYENPELLEKQNER